VWTLGTAAPCRRTGARAHWSSPVVAKGDEGDEALLKKQDKFKWTKEAQEAFEDLEKYLTTTPTLVTLEHHETLHLYISTTSNVVSTTIIIKWRELGTNCIIEYSVYFISKVLGDSKTQYFHIIKLAHALLITSYKLSHYFQAHQIEVHTSSMLGDILNNREAIGKITKWAIELSMYDIIYKPQMAIKAQALSDFVAKWIETQTPPKDKELEYLTINNNGSLHTSSDSITFRRLENLQVAMPAKAQSHILWCAARRSLQIFSMASFSLYISIEVSLLEQLAIELYRPPLVPCGSKE
jgi:hypothetical protein